MARQQRLDDGVGARTQSGPSSDTPIRADTRSGLLNDSIETPADHTSGRVTRARLRGLVLQAARRRLRFLAPLAQRIVEMQDDREFVPYRGYLLPPRGLRGMCGGVFSSDAFFLQSAVVEADRKSTRLNSSHVSESRMPSSA